MRMHFVRTPSLQALLTPTIHPNAVAASFAYTGNSSERRR
jgi:hypothetical protein